MASTNPNDYYKVKSATGYDIYANGSSTPLKPSDLESAGPGSGFVVNVDHIPVGNPPPAGSPVLSSRGFQNYDPVSNSYTTPAFTTSQELNSYLANLQTPSSTSIKNSINFDANKITSSTGLNVSAPSSVFGTPMLQNPPTLSPDIFGASASGTATAKGTPTQEAYLAEIKRIQAEQSAISEKASKGLAGLFTEAPKSLDFAEINKQALTSLGLPQDFTQTQFGLMNRTATEIDTLNKQMSDLSVQEQNAYIRTESQAIPMDSINSQKSQIERQYAIKKSGLAAEITSKAAYSESLRGNFTLVNQLIEKTASLATQAKAQEIADYKWMFENYQEEFKALTTREQSLYGDLLKSLEQEQKDAKAELTQKMNMFISAKVPIPDMINLTNMSIKDVARYVTQNMAPEKIDTSITEVGNRKLLINNQTGKVIKDLGVAKIPEGGGGFDSTGLSGTNKILVDSFNNAVIGLPAKQMAIAQNTFNNYLKSGDEKGAKDYLIRVAMAGATADQQNQAIGRKNGLATMMDVKQLLDTAKAKGASTNLLTGNLENVAQKLGATSNPDFAYIGSQIQQSLQVYRRSMTGVAFSPNESAEYAKIFPDITNIGTLNATKISSLIDSFNRNNRAVLSFYIGDNNYDQLFGKAVTPELPSGQQTQNITAKLDLILQGKTAPPKKESIFNKNPLEMLWNKLFK